MKWQVKCRHCQQLQNPLLQQVQAPPPFVPKKFEFLASSIVQVAMSSSTGCDAVSVSSQLDTHIAEAQAGVTLSVNADNALEFWHARHQRIVRFYVWADCF